MVPLTIHDPHQVFCTLVWQVWSDGKMPVFATLPANSYTAMDGEWHEGVGIGVDELCAMLATDTATVPGSSC